MKIVNSINPHCKAPSIITEDTRWYIRFSYTLDGRLKHKKMASGLNGPEFIKKVNGKNVEINKSGRRMYGNDLLAVFRDKLSTDYFNPHTGEFELSDKAELPFKKYLDEYIDYNPRKKRRESTKSIYLSYNNVIKEYLREQGGPNLSLKAVSREFVEKFLLFIENQSSTRQRDNYLVYLKGVFKFCSEYREVIPKSPIKLIHTIHTGSSKTNKAYPAELLDEVLCEAKRLDVHFWLLLRLIYYTLRRPEELLQVQYKDFDFKKRTIDFDSDIIKTNKKLCSTLPQHLMNDLKEMIPSEVIPTDYLFGNIGKLEGSKRISKKLFAPLKTPYYHFQDRFKTLQSRLNLDNGYTIYGMKHTGVVYMVEELRWSDKQIISYTGHTDTKILETYSKDAKRERMEHLGTI